MKTKSKIFLLLFLFFMCGCETLKHSKHLSPEKTSELFFNYLNNYEFDKARELGTDHTDKIVSFVETLSKLGGGGKIILHDSKSEFIRCNIKGKEAVCLYKTFDGNIQEVYLVKEKGKWLVDLRKDPE